MKEQTPRKKLPKSEKPMSIRLTPALRAEIDAVAEIMGKQAADVMRLASEIGLEHLKRIKYDLRTTAYEASMRSTEKL